MSGSLRQAKRRSNDATDKTQPSSKADTMLFDGNQLQLLTPEPDQEQLLSELARKRTLNKTIPQKINSLLKPIIEERDFILNRAKSLPIIDASKATNIATKLEKAIPSDLPKTQSGPQQSKNILAIHTAMKQYVEASMRPSRQVMKLYEPLDLAIKVVISSFQSDYQTKQSACFPSLNYNEKLQKYKQNGFVPTNIEHRTCIGCGHGYMDEPDSNKSLQQDYCTSGSCENLKQRNRTRKKKQLVARQLFVVSQPPS